MNTRRHFKATILAVAVAALSAGCATTSGPNQTLFYGTGNSYRQNGLQISELQVDSLGRGSSRMTIRSKADVSAIDALIKFYNRKAVEAVAANDAEQFAVAWSLGKKLTTARMEQELASQAFINDLLRRGNGQAALPGGARVFLPNALYADSSTSPIVAPNLPAKPRVKKGSSEKRSAVENLLDMVAELESPSSDMSERIQVAALGSLAGLLNGTTAASSTGDSTLPRMTAGVIEGMKEGSAYAVADSLGNKYIVEKTRDGLVLHNPDGAATKVDLKQMNFMPIWEKPAEYRYEAARIYKNMNAHLHDQWSKTRKFGVFSTLPPNRFNINGKADGYVNVDGSFSATESPTIQAAYGTNAAYKLAIDRASYQSMEADPIIVDFRANCSGSTWRDYHGETLEYVTYSCVDQRSRAVTYARTFVVSNDMKSQSWDSMLKDRSFRDAMKQAHNKGKLAEAFGAFVPLVGNLDAGLRCAGFESALNKYVTSYYAKDVSLDVRKFVTYSPELETPAAMTKALDCAQGIAGAASLGKGLTLAAQVAKIESLVTTPGYKNAMQMMSMLDTEFFYSQSKAAEIIDTSLKFDSPTSAFMAKVFYDKLQQKNDLSGAADAIINMVQG